MRYCTIIFCLVFAGMIIVSCKKNWIEEKSNKSLDVPTTVSDFQAVLDNSPIMNDNHPSIGEISADNYYLPANILQSWSTHLRNAYVWEPNIYSSTTSDVMNWTNPYRQVFYANIVLDGIDKVNAQELNSDPYKVVKGSALYYRADAFFSVSQTITKPYITAVTDAPGIPLRLTSDPNGTSVRATIQATYQQIIKDLQSAADYLPVTPTYKSRPSKPAAYGMLSRVYLAMHDYPKALENADACLKLYDSILDYNTLKSNVAWPIPAFNKEVIWQATIGDDLFITNNYFVDSNLYRSYDANDLRKVMFYKVNANNSVTFIGSYTGGTAGVSSKAFGGIATDEIYFTRAECYARTGNVTAAMSDLNKLMANRWSGTFTPFTAANATDALAIILRERRKETPFRGLRWVDLRRLNNEGANITITRNVNNQVYTLAPNDPRYTLPIPPEVITITGMEQNER